MMERAFLNETECSFILLIIAAYILTYHQFLFFTLASSKNKHTPPLYREFPHLPFFGSLIQFATNPRLFLQRASQKVGPCFTIHLFGKSMTFLTSSSGHRHFFRAPEDVYDIRQAYAMTVTTFGPGVCYDCSQRKMAEQFAFFKNGLSDECFRRYVELIQDEIRDYFFRKEWTGNEGEACLLHTLSNVFTLTSSRCLLGDEIRSRWNSSGMARHYLDLDHSFVPILFFFPWIPNPNRSKCVRARTLFQKIFREVMKERKEKEEGKDYEAPKDFLQVLMDAKYRNGDVLTVEEITGIMIGVLLGGQHTSNVTGTWLLCHLLHDKKWMDAVMNEQRALFDDAKKDNFGLHPKTLTYEQLQNQMPIFDRVLMETLRLHPPFFQLSRSVQTDTPFEQYTIPRGHIINISPSASHRLPSMWGHDADLFDPDRFLPENRKLHQPNSYVPFGGGMHQCGGRKFAWNSLKVGLTWVLRNYELELVGDGKMGMPYEDYTTMVVAPGSSRTRVRYRRRY